MEQSDDDVEGVDEAEDAERPQADVPGSPLICSHSALFGQGA
jgi:hypothetical protein